jgi:hypothetical protein
LTSGLHALDRRVQNPVSPPQGARSLIDPGEAARALDGDARCSLGQRPVLPHVPDRRSWDWQPPAATWVRHHRARRFGPSLPRIPNPDAGRTRALGRRVAPSGASALANVGAFASGARMPTGGARDRKHGSSALSANGAEGPRARDARRRVKSPSGRVATRHLPLEAGERQHRRHRSDA